MIGMATRSFRFLSSVYGWAPNGVSVTRPVPEPANVIGILACWPPANATMNPVLPDAGGEKAIVVSHTPSVPAVAWLYAVALPNTTLFASCT